MTFTTIQSKGALIPADLLAEIHTGEAPGQKPDDFGLDEKNVRLIDEIAACWSDALAFRHRTKRPPKGRTRISPKTLVQE